jgi:hypothetical protein
MVLVSRLLGFFWKMGLNIIFYVIIVVDLVNDN